METKSIAIIGGGPAGFFAAISAFENSNQALKIDIFEKKACLKTILQTGNGRCNLSNNIANFKELALNYPRGEKFLYSAFSRFGVAETMEWFASSGVSTYVQDDNRIFPKTDQASTIKELLLEKVAKHGIKIKKSCVQQVSKEDDKFQVHTQEETFEYDAVIIATGGDSQQNIASGYNIAESMGHTITELKPSLTSLLVKEKYTKNLAGVAVQNASVQSFFKGKKIYETKEDFLFTHKGLTGPAIFKTSAYCAYLDYTSQNPLVLKINFVPSVQYKELEQDLLKKIDSNKSIINVLKSYIKRSLATELLAVSNIDPEQKACEITKIHRKAIMRFLTETQLNITSPAIDGEIVTAGGVSLKEINSKTMESKLVKGLFFCGEVLDADGLTGGFNLQMCWSTGYVAGLNNF